MIDVKDFVKQFYGMDTEIKTLSDFCDFKKANGLEEWDYPLTEYSHIAENELQCVPVRFENKFGGYDYRFCEVKEFVITECYNKQTVWATRQAAMDFFFEGMVACEGSERDRYTNIYIKLKTGHKFCSDEE